MFYRSAIDRDRLWADRGAGHLLCVRCCSEILQCEGRLETLRMRLAKRPTRLTRVIGKR